jgi:hypothetical protein
VRSPRVVAGAALIAVLATVAVARSAGSWTPSPDPTFDPDSFTAVRLDSLSGSAGTTTPTLDPADDARGVLEPGNVLLEPAMPRPTGLPNPTEAIPAAQPQVVVVNPWHHDPEESWYGPGFYGQHTACGQVLTKTLLGVAHRTLPCGTMVSFRNPANGKIITVPVVDRGPYVSGREWDLTKAACAAIHHCYTGPLDWRYP